LTNNFQTSEKVSFSYRLEIRNPGGHSSLPTKDNAIYRLAEGLARLSRFDFPMKLNETTRAQLERGASTVPDAGTAADMRAVVQPDPDPAAVERLSKIVRYNAIMRTTCVATLVEAGHAINALPQTARATLNCRILPTESVEEVQESLVRVLADDGISVTPMGTPALSPPSPLNPEVLSTVENLSAEFWPGAPVIPTMLAAATDGSFLRSAGIPTYGHSGLANDVVDVRIHGKDERIPVKSFLDGQEYLYRLVKQLSSGSN
jgi:acetylornithine deacetylase/succinyl-diaminopimelate desuccinylase-like protein